MAKADGSYLKELAKIQRYKLIILDDFGLQPLDNQNRIALLEIIEDRHNNRFDNRNLSNTGKRLVRGYWRKNNC